MKNPLARFRQAGSFIAGLLIGVSVMIPMFAMMVTNPGDGQMVWVFCALVFLARGLKLRSVIAVKPRDRRAMAPARGILPVRLTELKLEQ